MTSEHALYAIEDILGGHCAVANFAVRALIDVATRPRVQAGVRAELAAVLGEGGHFGLEDKSRLSYLQVLKQQSWKHYFYLSYSGHLLRDGALHLLRHRAPRGQQEHLHSGSVADCVRV